MGGEERAGLSESKAHTAENTSLGQGEAQGKKHKSQTGCTEGDALQAASQSVSRAGGGNMVGRHAFNKAEAHP